MGTIRLTQIDGKFPNLALMKLKNNILNVNNKQIFIHYFKMCGGLFSFCFLHETVFGNGQVAITHNSHINEIDCVFITKILVTSVKLK